MFTSVFIVLFGMWLVILAITPHRDCIVQPASFHEEALRERPISRHFPAISQLVGDRARDGLHNATYTWSGDPVCEILAAHPVLGNYSTECGRCRKVTGDNNAKAIKPKEPVSVEEVLIHNIKSAPPFMHDIFWFIEDVMTILMRILMRMLQGPPLESQEATGNANLMCISWKGMVSAA